MLVWRVVGRCRELLPLLSSLSFLSSLSSLP